MATLREWMDAKNVDIIKAAETFDVSVHAIKKWLTGERVPRPKTQALIKKLTKGAVTGDAWLPKE